MRALDVPEDLIVALHEARTAKEFGPALFALVNQALPSRALVLFLRPLEFELPALCSRPEFQFVCDEYIAGRHTDDIWLQRSPINPDIPVVRHSDYTPQAMLRESTFYHRSMAPTGCEYGASIVAWKRDTWLATLTVLRTGQQGDIRDRELPVLRACQVHFQSAAIRVAMIREESLGRHSLETFVWSLPTAALVLDWSLKVLHYNAFAQELCHYWRLGAKASRLKGRRNLVVPGDLLAAIEAHKKAAEETKSNRPGSPEVIPLLEISHPQNPDLKAKVSFVPSRSLALSKGTFLVALQHHTPALGK